MRPNAGFRVDLTNDATGGGEGDRPVAVELSVAAFLLSSAVTAVTAPLPAFSSVNKFRPPDVIHINEATRLQACFCTDLRLICTQRVEAALSEIDHFPTR